MLSIVKILVACLTFRRLVYLEDMDGQITLTIARITPFGRLVAERWWPFPIKTITLRSDGSCEGASYVRRWKYFRD